MFYGSIPLSSMTPVLRDAITVCRVLGLRHLWIDSLCIQQDGGSTDWEEQSQEMSHIFGNSWLTICAPAAKSCLEGFLDHIDRHSGTIEIEFGTTESQQAQGCICLRLLTLNGKPGFHYDHLLAMSLLDPLQRDLKFSEWNTRGWVFQERILSRRLLYFGARMIHFQHGDRVSSENGSSNDGNYFDPSLGAMRYGATNLLHRLRIIQDQGPRILDLWYELVAVISPSNFTDRRDILPAIAGVARRVHEFTKHRYLAGLWEEDLFCGLLWDTRPSTDHLIRRSTSASLPQLLKAIKKADSIAPSWSWASRRSFLEFRIANQSLMTCRVRRHLRADTRILQSRVLVDGVNPYGRIRSASISLFGATMGLYQNSLKLAFTRTMIDNLHCEILPGFWAFVTTDWKSMRPRATGIKRRMRMQLQLLLIASCCSDWSGNGETRPVSMAPHNEQAKAKAEPPQRPHAGVWSTNKLTNAEMGNQYDEALKPEYMYSFHDDSHPDFDVAVDCDLCSDHSLRRDIWGLLIYPAGPADTFYRVGTFFSRAQHGGSAIFEGIEPRRIELI